MKRLIAVGAVLALLLVAASPALAGDKSISGTAVRVNMEQRTLVVKDSQGIESTVYWTESTRLDGGPLQEGAAVTLHANTDTSGKIMATSIQVKPKGSASEKKPVE